VKKTNRKDYVYGMKPYSWFKGSTLVLLGLLLTRWGIGVGRLDTNIYFGLPIFFLIAGSALLLSVILKIEEDRNKTAIKKLNISSIVLFSTAYITSICYTIIYNLDMLNIIILSIIGVALVLTWYYGKSWENRSILSAMISNFYAIGIIYGASLNGTLINTTVFIFFGAVFFLQLSKDLVNENKNKERFIEAGASTLALSLGEKRTQNISFILDIVVILLLLLPIIPGVSHIPIFIFYLIGVVITGFFIGIAALLTFLMKPEKTYYRAVKILLRIGMFFVFTVILLASF